MQFHYQDLVVVTNAPIAFVDITEQVKGLLRAHPLRHGQLTIASAHTTAFIAVNEREEGLQRDMVDFLGRLAPARLGYLHDREPVDGRENAHAHLLGLFMRAAETLIVADGVLRLGDWQAVFLVELDGPRPQRRVTLQLAGVP